LRVSIVNRLGGEPVVDKQGAPAVVRVDLDDAADTHFRVTDFLRTIKYANQLYLRINLTNPPAAGKSIYIDDLMMKASAALYAGGPLVVAYSGRRYVREDDSWTISVANDYAGEWATYMERVFALAANELRMPTTGTTLVNDSLIG